MKLALCLVTFLTVLITIEADQIAPDFLKFIGSYKYNTTDDGKITVKRYYSSNRITYNWIDAFMICKSFGMRMALIETNNELNNLASMGRKNSKLFEKRVFVGGFNLTVVKPAWQSNNNVDESETCYSLQKYRKQKLEAHSEKCDDKSNKFLCERTEIVDSYDEHQLSDDSVDVKATFFTYIGNFALSSLLPWSKKYYASFKLQARSNDVPKICKSFGMQMASPKNQAEYDNLGKILQNFNEAWNLVSVAGYRSDEHESEWIVNEKKINYKIDWDRGEPNNYGGLAYCIALKNMNIPKMHSIPCDRDAQFLCEFDDSMADTKIPVQIDPMFLKPLTNYKIGSTTKELFFGVFEADWTTANLMCHNFGMELFTPSLAEDDETLRKELSEFTGAPDDLHVGITAMGTDDVWYSVNTGKILDLDLEWSHYSSYYPADATCAKLTKIEDKYSYAAVACTKRRDSFICQKVIEATEDEQSITSTTPAS